MQKRLGSIPYVSFKISYKKGYDIINMIIYVIQYQN